MVRFVPQFPLFAQGIADAIAKGRYFYNKDEKETMFMPGITYALENFQIVGFIDGSLFRTSTPGTGPVGDFLGFLRHDGAYITQHAFYMGWKKSWFENIMHNIG